jgi:hypothetical protein
MILTLVGSWFKDKTNPVNYVKRFLDKIKAEV